mmetsp:Transcript_23524/g.51628  ORF Transcript_23524/g.51628 Transcript_23524/m.51628 type:complete len:288 (+) Transcript_23524:173-1036(+)
MDAWGVSVTSRSVYSISKRAALRRHACFSHVHARPKQVLRATQQQVSITGSCYEDIVDQLARRALQAAQAKGEGSKYIVGIAGGPGSGKSTLATLAMTQINKLAAQGQQGQASPVAVVLPMDGFHYYKRQLDAMPDPKEAYARRGAHWTFDAEAFVRCVQQVRDTGCADVPSFDHAVGDPMQGDIKVLPHHRVVLVEGNYVLLDIAPWDQLKQIFDDTWYVDVDIDVAMDRVFRRQTGNGLDPDVSRGRIRSNDRPNGELIAAASRSRAAVLVPSSVPFRAPAASGA